MTLAFWANLLTVIQVCIILYKQWITAQGKLRLCYWLMIAGGALGLVSHSMMAIVATDIAIGLISTLSLMLWSIIMGVKGLVRLNEDDPQLRMITEAMEALDGSDTKIVDDLRAKGAPIWGTDEEGRLVRKD